MAKVNFLKSHKLVGAHRFFVPGSRRFALMQDFRRRRLAYGAVARERGYSPRCLRWNLPRKPIGRGRG